MKQPCIAFCTTCKGRLQHLKETLPHNLQYNVEYPNAKFIVLDYGCTDGTADYFSGWCMGRWQDRLSIYQMPPNGPFHMAHAKNMAHRLGMLEGGEILVNLDADNFTGPRFAEYIAEQFENAREEMFLWSRMIQHTEDRLPRGISGRIAVTARAFLKAGGYDEKYNTWAPDDRDFNLRLQRLGYVPREIHRQYLSALTHPDKMRFREYPHAQANAGDYEFEDVNQSETTIANFGRFGMGTVYRIDPSPACIHLGPLPTRIFGIGMHKTATTSLHRALQILGYDSGHWKSAHWAKAIWDEMKAAGRSLTVERCYALTDLPITILYRELDRAYPGSKFILTVRDENAWLRSVRNHWDPAHNRFRSAWDTDPFTHKVHAELYGRKRFDREIFWARYQRHNADVREYFKNRPDDLLIMDMESAGWPELCSFLRRPVPAVPYPTEFATP